jgi:hypothetical protein
VIPGKTVTTPNMVITCRIRFIEKAVLLRKADFLNNIISLFTK